MQRTLWSARREPQVPPTPSSPLKTATDLPRTVEKVSRRAHVPSGFHALSRTTKKHAHFEQSPTRKCRHADPETFLTRLFATPVLFEGSTRVPTSSKTPNTHSLLPPRLRAWPPRAIAVLAQAGRTSAVPTVFASSNSCLASALELFRVPGDWRGSPKGRSRSRARLTFPSTRTHPHTRRDRVPVSSPSSSSWKVATTSVARDGIVGPSGGASCPLSLLGLMAKIKCSICSYQFNI